MIKSRKVRSNFRKLRVRSNIFGTPDRPRLSVHRSLKHIYAQVIDDLQGKTLVSASTLDKSAAKASGTKAAELVGETLGKKAVAKGVKQVVFDRGPKRYHGRVAALAEGARKGGLKF